MAHKVRIGASEVIQIQETGERLLSVQFSIVKTEEGQEDLIVDTRRHGFPVAATPEEVEAELGKVLSGWLRDKHVSLIKADEEAETAQATETIEALSEKEIVPQKEEDIEADAIISENP